MLAERDGYGAVLRQICKKPWLAGERGRIRIEPAPSPVWCCCLLPCMKEVGFIHFRLRRHPALGRSSPRAYSPAPFMLLVLVSPFEIEGSCFGRSSSWVFASRKLHIQSSFLGTMQRCLDLHGGSRWGWCPALVLFATCHGGPNLHLGNEFGLSARVKANVSGYRCRLNYDFRLPRPIGPHRHDWCSTFVRPRPRRRCW